MISQFFANIGAKSSSNAKTFELTSMVNEKPITINLLYKKLLYFKQNGLMDMTFPLNEQYQKQFLFFLFYK
jgi:hypothetical protein